MPSSPLHHSSKTLIPSPRLTTLLLIFSSLFNFYLLVSLNRIPTVQIRSTATPTTTSPPPLSSPSPPITSPHHLVFGIASSSNSWHKRKHYVSTWWKPQKGTRGYVFLDRLPSSSDTATTLNLTDGDLPPLLISEDTSRFPYTFKGGLRSAIRVARIVKETVDRNLSDVRWFVFGDDDTVFFVESLAKTLSKYDHDRWYYVGSNSESLEQNYKYSFDMAFGGGGFAISYSLGKVLARVLDSCLMKYAHLYGSDARVFSCLAELGIGLTHEPGFHQVDVRGDLFGMLSAHPLAPLVSLHHLDYADPIFPNMNRSQALEHLFKAVEVDPVRVLQHTVCYDHSNLQTISISWGYAIQVFEGILYLPDLLPLQRTFMPWKRGVSRNPYTYVFNTRDFPKDPCQRPTVFFFGSVVSAASGITSEYSRYAVKDCSGRGLPKNVKQVKVLSQKLELDVGKLQAPRRYCCDVVPFGKEMNIGLRECKDEELISMN